MDHKSRADRIEEIAAVLPNREQRDALEEIARELRAGLEVVEPEDRVEALAQAVAEAERVPERELERRKIAWLRALAYGQLAAAPHALLVEQHFHDEAGKGEKPRGGGRRG